MTTLRCRPIAPLEPPQEHVCELRQPNCILAKINGDNDMKKILTAIALGLTALAMMSCGGTQSNHSASPAPTPQPLAVDSSNTVAETLRLDLAPDVVVAFVQGLTQDAPEKLAYVTHVPSGSQAILDSEGRVVHRHD